MQFRLFVDFPTVKDPIYSLLQKGACQNLFLRFLLRFLAIFFATLRLKSKVATMAKNFVKICVRGRNPVIFEKNVDLFFFILRFPVLRFVYVLRGANFREIVFEKNVGPD